MATYKKNSVPQPLQDSHRWGWFKIRFSAPSPEAHSSKLGWGLTALKKKKKKKICMSSPTCEAKYFMMLVNQLIFFLVFHQSGRRGGISEPSVLACQSLQKGGCREEDSSVPAEELVKPCPVPGNSRGFCGGSAVRPPTSTNNYPSLN